MSKSGPGPYIWSSSHRKKLVERYLCSFLNNRRDTDAGVVVDGIEELAPSADPYSRATVQTIRVTAGLASAADNRTTQPRTAGLIALTVHYLKATFTDLALKVRSIQFIDLASKASFGTFHAEPLICDSALGTGRNTRQSVEDVEIEVSLVAVTAVGICYCVAWAWSYWLHGDRRCLVIGVARTNSSSLVFESILLASEHTVSVLASEFIVIWVGTCRHAPSSELEGWGGTRTGLVSEK